MQFVVSIKLSNLNSFISFIVLLLLGNENMFDNRLRFRGSTAPLITLCNTESLYESAVI